MWDCTGKQNLIKKNSVKHEMLLITSHRIDKEPLLYLSFLQITCHYDNKIHNWPYYQYLQLDRNKTIC